MYKVIKFFTDLQDGNHAYNVGDTFPREGLTASEARIKELSTSENKQHAPLIKLVKDAKPKTEAVEEKKPIEESKVEAAKPQGKNTKRKS